MTPKEPQHIVITGTGPASLLKALQLADHYKSARITLIDSNATPGGAWYSDFSPAGCEIECGCHIWSYVPKAYRFIEEELKIPLIPVKPAPVFVNSWLHLPYSVKNTADTYTAFFKTLFTLRWNKFGDLMNDPNMNFRIIGKRNKYPRTGSPELIHALLKRVSENPSIRIELNQKITRFDFTKNKLVLQSSNGSSYTPDRLFLTYVSHIGELSINGETHFPRHRQVDYIHFLLRLNKPLLKKIFYWRLMNDPIIHRITDISYQSNNQEHLLLIGIKDKSYHTNVEENLLYHCEQILLKYKLIDSSHQLEKLKTHIFPTHYLSEETLSIIKTCEPQVSLMHTTDLMHGIYFLLEKKSFE